MKLVIFVKETTSTKNNLFCVMRFKVKYISNDNLTLATPMHIIHISGMPGSGKSTLGEKIAHTFVNSDVRVIDTDDLIVRNTPNGNELLELEKLSPQQDPGGLKYNTRWREIFSREIQWNIDKSNEDGMKILVFVGILDHFGH